MKILIIEDVHYKFEEVAGVILEFEAQAKVSRAQTVVEAEELLSQDWDLVILDISMDIAPNSSHLMRDGHANLGGMDLLEQMYLLEREINTVIVTGFDYFVNATLESENQEAQTFTDLEQRARGWIGDKLLGCVRFGQTGWQSQLERALKAGKK